MKLKYFALLVLMVGMVGCEKEAPKASEVNIKRHSVAEIEASIAKADKEARERHQAKEGLNK